MPERHVSQVPARREGNDADSPSRDERRHDVLQRRQLRPAGSQQQQHEGHAEVHDQGEVDGVLEAVAVGRSR